MTLIELVVVLAVLGILLAIAMPGYKAYMLRVHRTDAIRMLLQASICQQRIYAATGNYDTGQCQGGSEPGHYRLSYTPAGQKGQHYVALASPSAAQSNDPCGSLSLNQDGERAVTARDAVLERCWNGR